MTHVDISNPRDRTSLLDVIRQMNPWFHNIHLPDGTQTAPDHWLGDFPRCKWVEIEPFIGSDMKGRTVLDIGCNAGFYSIEMAMRGAAVLGIDSNTHYLRQAQWSADQFGVSGSVEFRNMQVYDLAKLDRKFDLVLFLGVLYHLRYPLLGLDIVTQKVGERLIFQSLTMPGLDVCEPVQDSPIEQRGHLASAGWPRMAFIENRLAGDPTNWWAPNHACMEAMLRTCGMKIVTRPGSEIYLCERDFNAAPAVENLCREEFEAITGMRDFAGTMTNAV